MLKHLVYGIIELYHKTDNVLKPNGKFMDTRTVNYPQIKLTRQKVICVKLSSMSTDDVPHHVQTSVNFLYYTGCFIIYFEHVKALFCG